MTDQSKDVEEQRAAIRKELPDESQLSDEEATAEASLHRRGTSASA
jgi:hypothetical protein